METTLKIIAAVVLMAGACLAFGLLTLVALVGVGVVPAGILLTRAASALAPRLKARRIFKESLA